MTHKIAFISKDDKFMSPDLVDENNLKFEYFKNNKLSLAKIYNQIIENNKEFDYLYLIHADVKMDFDALVRHVESVADKYDVIGLCGCAKISVS